MWSSEKTGENKNNFAGQSFSCTSSSCDQLYQAIFDTGVSEPPLTPPLSAAPAPTVSHGIRFNLDTRSPQGLNLRMVCLTFV